MSANTILAVRDHAPDELSELRKERDAHLREAARLGRRIAVIEAMRALVEYDGAEDGRGVIT